MFAKTACSNEGGDFGLQLLPISLRVLKPFESFFAQLGRVTLGSLRRGCGFVSS